MVTAPRVEVAAPVVAAVVTFRYAEILYRPVTGDATRLVAVTAAVCAVRSTADTTAADVGTYADTLPEPSVWNTALTFPAGADGVVPLKFTLNLNPYAGDPA